MKVTQELVDRTEQKMTGNGDIVRLDTENGQKLADMFSKLEGLCWYEDEDCLLGAVYILGVAHHVTFVRVVVPEAGELYASRDPHHRLEDILAGSTEGQPQTVELPGFEGRWVIGISPYC